MVRRPHIRNRSLHHFKLGREYDEEDIPQDDDEDSQSSVDNLNGVLSAIQKMHYSSSYVSLSFTNSQLCKIVMAVRSSPQRRQAWLNKVTISLRQTESALKQVALILILDVKTRWSSTHQMLREYWSIYCCIVLKETVSFRLGARLPRSC